jgi:hypothetical protein
MLIAALSTMGVTVCLGMWLGALYLVREEAPKRIPITGLVHGSAGALCVLLLLLALRGPPRGVHTGAGAFGWASFGLLATALLGGATILGFHLRRRGAPTLLIAMHGMLGAAGGILLAAWWASPVSFDR